MKSSSSDTFYEIFLEIFMKKARILNHDDRSEDVELGS
jgi:hypothetical protein